MLFFLQVTRVVIWILRLYVVKGFNNKMMFFMRIFAKKRGEIQIYKVMEQTNLKQEHNLFN